MFRPLCRALALVLLSAGTVSAGDWVPGVRITESVNSVTAAARDVSDLGDYGFDTNVCILSGFLLDGRELSFNRPLDKGESYLLVGGGDRNTTGIEVDVYDPNGNRVDSDNGDSVAIKFKATKSANYQLKVKLTKTKGKGGGFVTLALLRKGGFDLPVTNLKGALETVIQGAEEVNKLVKDAALFQSGNNQWALYGAVLEQGDDLTITRVKLGKGERMLVAGGDKNAEDVDAFVMNDEKIILARDKGRDPFAFVKFVEDEDEFRAIKFKNNKSKRGGPTLILTAVLTLD